MFYAEFMSAKKDDIDTIYGVEIDALTASQNPKRNIQHTFSN